MQLSLASIHYLRSHYQEAINIYRRIVLENREYAAVHVYIALCYYKLDYYDVSMEVLEVYLQVRKGASTRATHARTHAQALSATVVAGTTCHDTFLRRPSRLP